MYEELDETGSKVKKTVADGESLISKSKGASANHIKQNVELLKQRWKNIQMRAADKKVKARSWPIYGSSVAVKVILFIESLLSLVPKCLSK